VNNCHGGSSFQRLVGDCFISRKPSAHSTFALCEFDVMISEKQWPQMGQIPNLLMYDAIANPVGGETTKWYS
jgi:hypothetical protein